MTQEQFERAQTLKQRIRSICELIELFSTRNNFSLDPPTRMSGYIIHQSGLRSQPLNEAEVVLFLDALVKEKNRLEQEFGRL